MQPHSSETVKLSSDPRVTMPAPCLGMIGCAADVGHLPFVEPIGDITGDGQVEATAAA
jgi:hypothetical protein